MDHKDGMFGNRPDQQGEEMGVISKCSGMAVVCITDANEKTGICLHKKMVCDCIEDWLQRDTPDEIVDGVKSSCDESRGFLLVGQDFGCIHHEEKTILAL